MKASWKTSGAGIATIVVGVGNLVISVIQNKTVTTEAAGVAVTAVIAGIGLMNAKDDNVSNSPKPLPNAQAVTDTLQAAIIANIPPAPVEASVAMVEQVMAKPAPEPPHKF